MVAEVRWGLGGRGALLLLCAAAVLVAAAFHAPPAKAEVVWLCHPGMQSDPCEIPLDTTEESNSGSQVVTPERVAEDRRPVDCFYVYPTVSNQLSTNASQSRDPELESIAKFQASRFSTNCRIFAPIYRQITLAGIAGFGVSGPGSPAETAYSDVLEAWRSYLANDNDGRGVVLIGHSQGSIMLRQLIRTEIENHPDQQKLLVSGVLLGGNVSVRAGSDVGGDFKQTPTCSQPGQFGCVVAYSTYSTDPGPTTFFGNTNTDNTSAAFNLPTGPGFEVACTDPGVLSGETGPVGVTIPSEQFAAGPINAGIVVTNGGPPPTASTTWVKPADRYTGGCRSINGANVYRYDPVGASKRPNEFPPAWGTHLLDANLGVDPLGDIVRTQESNWLASGLRLGKPDRNRRRGTAKIPVSVPGAGDVKLRSKKLRNKVVTTTEPRKLTLKVKPRGKTRRAIHRRGGMRVNVKVKYRPAVGSASKRTKRVRLRIRP